jgi:hypothetical protein
VTADEHRAEIAKIEADLAKPAQVRDASGRYIARDAAAALKALEYHRGEVARLTSAAQVAAGIGSRQVRVIYGGRGY